VKRLAVAVLLATATLACRNGVSAAKRPPTTILRVGLSLGMMPLANPTAGVRQFFQNVTTEGLVGLGEDGRMIPQLADRWALTDTGRTLRIELTRGAKFQDGSPVDASTVAALLPDVLRGAAGSLADDIESIRPSGTNTVEVRYRQASPLMLESLESPIRKSGSSGLATGPFVVAGPTELRANAGYYRGAPSIDQITVETFPSVRMAWAELLRNNIDMLYEVGPDALDSLENAKNVSVFTFLRRYQYALIFNSSSPVLHSKEIRRAMNLSVDRAQLVRQALNGHGLASTGPVWPKYWAVDAGAPHFDFKPAEAAHLMNGKTVHVKCLMPSDPLYERIALELSRQLARTGVELDLVSLSADEMMKAQRAGDYDAVLTEIVSGPTLLRLYSIWHSQGTMHMIGRGTATVEAALNRASEAATDEEFRAAVGGVQQAFVDDPPALFVAWTERARAVSRRFVVPPESGRDILATLRLWAQAQGNERRIASRN
jgi:peptide/nickel transport system substrate-binding protein